MAQSILQICKLSSKTIQNQGISICKTHSNPQQRKPAEGKEHPSPATTTCKRKSTPIPRNFNLQKERAVRLSFTFEGHGDHYIKRVMQWCRVNYGVVLLLCVESLMAGSTTGVPMSSWYGGYQTATPPPYYRKRKKQLTQRPTDALKYYSAPSYYTTEATEDDYACCPILRGSYTQAPNCYTEVPADCCTEAAKYYSAPIYTTVTEAAKYCAVPTYCTEAALSYYVEQKYYTDAPVHYTTTYATPQPPIYYTEAPKYYITKAPEFCTSMYATPAYYTEAPHYYNTEALKYYTTTYASPRYYTYVPKYYCTSCTDVFKYYTTKAPEFYTTTYAAPSHYTDALKYYSALSYYTI
ncbi:hypothetical protein DAPPUDRAFT_233205 [Daphnia pulex]|uniref:Uncharacterized protein n=1 Tax=Daphnia pulex TaxID=6669 RepID=E9FTI2_DAPPU|nr:hypothetical protein DAPPUDRAFT_233205 [Daphnia pulex]|eukprot:EFX89367.1 hypothetical protein DAPPUDRAFT_233205 [Daphnia pulex]